MATTFGSIKATGTAVFAGAVTAAAITMSGVLTGTSATFTGDVTSGGTMSGSTLHLLTGAILGDSDGAGCSAVYVLNGTVSAATVACP